jgi:predicted esterase
MTARYSLVTLILGAAFGSLVFADRCAAQAASQPQPATRLNDARLAALRSRIGNHAPSSHAPALQPGYYPDVRVLAPGRLDWTFVVSKQSLDPAPTALTAGYVATRQSYELYVPSGHNPRQPYAMILQVNTGPRSDGWVHWQQTCKRRGVLLAGVHHAGNDVPFEARARAVLDVLDDVRRRFPIDPDRTYISGMSGAGHAASSIAFALPELFGGHVAICGAWNLRVEPMLRQRVSERLSVAILTGATDFNRPELEREFFPILREHKARALLRVYPGIGHAYPSAAELDQVFAWLEAGLPQRRLLGSLFPASRLAHAPTPVEWSSAVLLEGRQRLEMPGREASGLFLLQGVIDRWPGLPAAQVAQKLLDEFDASSPVPWKQLYQEERMRFRYLQARTFDGIVNAPPPPGYPVPHSNLVRIALALWQEVHDLAPADSPISQEASARLAVLRK